MSLPKFKIGDIVEVNKEYDMWLDNKIWEYIFLRSLSDKTISIKEFMTSENGFYYRLEPAPAQFFGKYSEFPEEMLKLNLSYSRDKKINRLL